jgi:hypothetical protein
MTALIVRTRRHEIGTAVPAIAHVRERSGNRRTALLLLLALLLVALLLALLLRH